jgi:ubiquinone/menaquinone biosynthesis C-methylase UbiE
MLLEAKTRVDQERTMLLTADAAAIPLGDSSVNLVFSRGSIFFWSNLETCLKEIQRVLRPGGFALLGGGYGFSTPEELLKPILRHRHDKKDRSSIPRLDLDELLQIARRVFSQAEIVQHKKRGFWLSCHKK